jgi:hypothetical protein
MLFIRFANRAVQAVRHSDCVSAWMNAENTIAGHIKWTGFRSRPKPTIRIEHLKTGAIIDHPLEADGVKSYAEEVLAKLPRRGC